MRDRVYYSYHNKSAVFVFCIFQAKQMGDYLLVGVHSDSK